MSYSYHSTKEFPYRYILDDLLDEGKLVDTGHWQSLKNVPHTRTVELHRVLIEIPIAPTVGSWGAFCLPNLPWAEDHFQERVAGEPTNPGEQYKNWPWYKEGWEAQPCPSCGEKGKWQEAGSLLVCTVCGNNTGLSEPEFSHTYMERFWARKAGSWHHPYDLQGIRYRFGDLNDVLDLLAREPHTRQAYLPVWFPEDTGAHHGERVPCTLGYHFMLREDRLHCFYPMRSVDLVRYLRDDAYMAGRLVQEIIWRLCANFESSDTWCHVAPGTLSMFCSSLHVFEDEIPMLRKKHEQAATK